MIKDVDDVSRWCFQEPLLICYEQEAASLRLRLSSGPTLHSIDPVPIPISPLCHLPCIHHPGAAHPVQIPCFIASMLPSNDTWLREYKANPCTNLLLLKLKESHVAAQWSLAEVAFFPAQYCETNQTNRMFWSNHCLFLSHSRSASVHGSLVVIINPHGLRILVFRALHFSPVAGHMGRTKTVYHMLVHFIFPGLYAFVESAVKSCTHCILANSVVHDARELIYSSPFSELFSIVHIDLWALGIAVFPSGNSYIFVCMDELTGFVYVTPVPDSGSSTLAKHLWSFSLSLVSVPHKYVAIYMLLD